MAVQQETASQTSSAKKDLETELAGARAQMEELVETQRQLIAQAAKTQKEQGQDLNTEREKLKGIETQLQKAKARGEELKSDLARKRRGGGGFGGAQENRIFPGSRPARKVTRRRPQRVTPDRGRLTHADATVAAGLMYPRAGGHQGAKSAVGDQHLEAGEIGRL